MSDIKDAAAEEVIKQIGGNAETAKLCEVTPAAVSQWARNGIPKPRLMFLKLARPEIFGLTRRRSKPPP